MRRAACRHRISLARATRPRRASQSRTTPMYADR
jgi:hypothetical protein